MSRIRLFEKNTLYFSYSLLWWSVRNCLGVQEEAAEWKKKIEDDWYKIEKEERNKKQK